MADQSFASHRRWVPAYHFFLTALLLSVIVGSVINLLSASGTGLYSASLITAMAVGLLMTALFARLFPLAAQDRVIRLEENLRHQDLTGKRLDSRITDRQIVGLRFASDDEFPALAERAADEGLSEAKIKESVKNWRADNTRV